MRKISNFFPIFRKAIQSNANQINNIAIIGIGGVGGYYGGKIASAYSLSNHYKIYFVARNENGKKIQTDGLDLITPTSRQTIQPYKTVNSINELPFQDLIILAVKYYDLENILADLKSISHTNTYVMPLLNGVSAKDDLEKKFSPDKIVDACVYISSQLTSPGVINQSGGSCELLLGSNLITDDKLDEIKAILVGSGINASIKPNILTEMWNKYLFVSSMSCMTVAYSCNKVAILSNHKLLNELRHLIQEMVAVALAKGVVFDESIIDQAIEKIKRMSPQTIPSMQRDFLQGKRIEIEIFPKYIIEQAKKLSLSVPYHLAILQKLELRLKMRKECIETNGHGSKQAKFQL